MLGFIVIEICEIFSVGGIPLDDNVRKVGDLDMDRKPASSERSF